MLFYPAMRKMGRKWLGVLLSLTVGLLVFLFADTLLEGFEVANLLPGVFQGIPLFLFAALLTWLVLLAIGAQRKKAAGSDPSEQTIYLATHDCPGYWFTQSWGRACHRCCFFDW